jgi:hypothetical protein
VADPALLVAGPCGIKKARLFMKRGLGVRLMTAIALLVPVSVFHLPVSVHSLFQRVEDLAMTGEAMIHVEKIRSFLDDVRRTGMDLLSSYLFMAVLAGKLAVDRGMKLLRVDEPGRLRRGRQA